MKFDYAAQYTEYGISFMPLVLVEFLHPDNRAKKKEVFSLVDSGAANTLINAQYAEELGIYLESGKRLMFQGIKGPPVVGYEHTLMIRLKHDFQHEFSIPCYFMHDLATSALLGQQGFFESYKALFERYKKKFELTPRN